MKKLIFYILTSLCLLIILDLGIGGFFYALKHVRKDYYYKFFDFSDSYFRSLENNEHYFEMFMKEYYDPVTGWNSPSSGHLVSYGCLGRWEAFYNDDGSRSSCSADLNQNYQIICVGDSFTHGNEVDDCSTYPAALQNMLGGKVGNFGVGGYSTIQSVLQFEEVLSRTDPPTIGILGIVYENPRRDLNSFLPIYFNYFDLYSAFSFKPFFDGVRVVDPVIKTENTLEDYKRQAREKFVSDYWARPKLKFPFSISLVQALRCPYFEYHFQQKFNHMRGRGTFAHDYKSPMVLNSIRYSVDRFVNVCISKDIFPIVIFIPTDSKDLTSPNLIIEELQEAQPRARILYFGGHEMDWSEYSPGEGCHPTAQGYAEIAEFLHSLIVDEGLIIMDSADNYVENIR
jgi:hypothetical protein